MRLRRSTWPIALALIASSPVHAQSDATVARPGAAVSFAATAELDGAALRAALDAFGAALEAQADALAHGLLPTVIGDVALARPAAGGGGAVGALGTISSALGPLSNSVASLTFERDPMLSNGTSETFAAIGLGTAVVGGVLNLVAGGADNDGMAGRGSTPDVAAALDGFRDNQGAAERLLSDLEAIMNETDRLTARIEAGELTAADRRAADALLRRGERSTLRFDYLTRTALSNLARLGAGGAQSPDDVETSRLRREVELAEVRLHRALEPVRLIESEAFGAMGTLRARLQQ